MNESTQVSLPGESHGQRAWRVIVHSVAEESDTTEATWHETFPVFFVMETTKRKTITCY